MLSISHSFGIQLETGWHLLNRMAAALLRVPTLLTINSMIPKLLPSAKQTKKLNVAQKKCQKCNNYIEKCISTITALTLTII